MTDIGRKELHPRSPLGLKTRSSDEIGAAEGLRGIK